MTRKSPPRIEVDNTRIIALFRDGLSVIKIAEEVGCGRGVVTHRLRLYVPDEYFERNPPKIEQPQDGEHKICSGCRETLALDSFDWHPNGLYDKKSKCKQCTYTTSRAWLKENPERAAAYRQRQAERGRQRRLADPLVTRRANIKKKYGITLEAYEKFSAEQDHLCKICKRNGATRPRNNPNGYLCVDHDRSCCPSNSKTCGKCIRGLLCSTCNLAIGYFQDNTEWLRAAITYLETYQERNTNPRAYLA